MAVGLFQHWLCHQQQKSISLDTRVTRTYVFCHLRILTQPKIPPWGTECGSCLMDYVPGVGKHLEEIVSAVFRSVVIIPKLAFMDKMMNYMQI